MMSTKFFVSVLVLAEISCVWSFAAQDIGLQDVQVYSTKAEWMCTSDADCTAEGSSCLSLTCQCSPQHVFNAAMTACLKAATMYGDYCIETAQCTAFLKAGGFCNKNRCTCSEGYHYIHGRCHKSAGLNQKCRTADDCYVNSDYGAFSCKNETCVCRDGYYQREYRTCRLEATESGAECTINMDCTYNKEAECDPESATCFVRSERKFLNIELRGSENEGPKTFQDGLFYSGIDYGTKYCTSDEQCAVLGEALCDSTTGMCACKPGYFFDPQMPRCNAEIGEKCEEGDINIIMNSTCRFGQWSCMGATVPSKNNRFCYTATTQYGAYCNYDEQCYVFGPDASCVDNRCRCSKDSHYSAENQFCWVNKLPGESCVVDADCYLPGFGSQLACNSESVCACPKDTHVNVAGTACVKDVPVLGDSCSGYGDCKGLKNVDCSEGYCTCEMLYFELAGECVNGNYAPCEIDNDCKIENSVCQGKRCGCKHPFVPSGIDSCVKGVPFGGHCENDAGCRVNTSDSYCNATSKCDCPENYRHNGTRCYKIKGFDDRCDWSTDICWDENHPDSMECNMSTCRCKQGYQPSFNWIYCEPEIVNAASQNMYLGWISLTIFSTWFMGLL